MRLRTDSPGVLPDGVDASRGFEDVFRFCWKISILNTKIKVRHEPVSNLATLRLFGSCL